MDSIVKREGLAVALRKQKKVMILRRSRLRLQSKWKPSSHASLVDSLSEIVSNPPADTLQLIVQLRNLFSVED